MRRHIITWTGHSAKEGMSRRRANAPGGLAGSVGTHHSPQQLPSLACLALSCPLPLLAHTEGASVTIRAYFGSVPMHSIEFSLNFDVSKSTGAHWHSTSAQHVGTAHTYSTFAEPASSSMAAQGHERFLPALVAAMRTVREEGSNITTASFVALMQQAS